MTTLDAMWETLAKRPSATRSDISRVELELGLRLPDDLQQVLLCSDGFEGFVNPDAYLMLWSCSDSTSSSECFSRSRS